MTINDAPCICGAGARTSLLSHGTLKSNHLQSQATTSLEIKPNDGAVFRSTIDLTIESPIPSDNIIIKSNKIKSASLLVNKNWKLDIASKKFDATMESAVKQGPNIPSRKNDINRNSIYKTLCTNSNLARPRRKGLYCHDASGLCSSQPRAYGYTKIQDLNPKDSTNENCATYGLGTISSWDDCQKGLIALTDWDQTKPVKRVVGAESNKLPGCSLNIDEPSEIGISQGGYDVSTSTTGACALNKEYEGRQGFCVCLNAPQCNDDADSKTTINKSPCICGKASCTGTTGYLCDAVNEKCKCPIGHFKDSDQENLCRQCCKNDLFKI